LIPLAFLLVVTMTAGWQKVFAADPRLGFLAHARDTAAKVATGAIEAGTGARLIFNDRLNAVVASFFMVVTVVLLVAAIREWVAVVQGRKPAVTREAPFVETAYG